MHLVHVAISQKICLDCDISVSEGWNDHAKVGDGHWGGDRTCTWYMLPFPRKFVSIVISRFLRAGMTMQRWRMDMGMEVGHALGTCCHFLEFFS